jgi:hypothetical protein
MGGVIGWLTNLFHQQSGGPMLDFHNSKCSICVFADSSSSSEETPLSARRVRLKSVGTQTHGKEE